MQMQHQRIPETGHAMNLQPAVLVSGIEWKLFSVEFRSPDGRFSAYFYAIDAEHASYQVEAIRENGVAVEIVAV
jgi:hypothetical protein